MSKKICLTSAVGQRTSLLGPFLRIQCDLSPHNLLSAMRVDDMFRIGDE